MNVSILESKETYQLKNRRRYVKYAWEETKKENFKIELENIDKILLKRNESSK
jgi:hypothetical protein